MLPDIMKWVSSAMLLLAALFWRTAPDYELLLTAVVFMGAVVVLRQAIEERGYYWAVGFAVIALVFNPAAPLFRASGEMFRLTTMVCTVIFLVSLTALKTTPRLSIPSLTRRHPRSESL